MGDLFKICSITHWPNINLNRIRMQLPFLGILSLSGYFFVKDKTDIRDQNPLIVKTIYKECQTFSLGKIQHRMSTHILCILATRLLKYELVVILLQYCCDCQMSRP